MKRPKRISFLALIATAIISAGTLPAQVTITRQSDGVTVKTAVDVLRVTVCGPTSIHVVASPDGTATAATPKQPWLIQVLHSRQIHLHHAENSACPARGI